MRALLVAALLSGGCSSRIVPRDVDLRACSAYDDAPYTAALCYRDRYGPQPTEFCQRLCWHVEPGQCESCIDACSDTQSTFLRCRQTAAKE